MMACCSLPPAQTSEIEAYIQDLDFPKRKPKLVSIAKSEEHKLTLEDWTKQLDASSRNLARKISSRNTSTSDLSQILALFFVFQGVVLTAVAQASALTCHNWYLVFSLSAISFVAAFGSSVQKLREIAESHEQYLLERAVYSSLYKKIELLKEFGADLDLQAHQPELRDAYIKKETTGSGSLAGWGTNLINFCRVWVLSYAGGLLFLLCAFSGIILAAARLIVCDPGRATSAPAPAP